MSYSIALANQKGGVGKTTSVINIGAALAEQNKRVLVVDFDPQGNLTTGLGINPTKGKTVYEVMSGNIAVSKAIQRTTVGGMHIIPADVHLSGMNIELVTHDNRESYLKRKIASVKQQYDYILIDSPPSLEILTVNALVAADAVIVPLQCEYFAMEGLKELLKSIRTIRNTFNNTLKVLGILCTMYDSRTKLSQEVVAEMASYFKGLMFRTIIPRNVRIAEAPSYGLPILRYDTHSLGAESYRAMSKELVERAPI